MFSFKDVTVIIPSLNPDEKFVKTVDGIFDAGFTSVILVNDGSKAECVRFFEEAKDRHPGCAVLTHEVNKGKGRAMKTAFSYYLSNVNGPGVVTVDGDGQHLPDDVKKVCEYMLENGKLTLGARDFSLPSVPGRSRFGNRLTSFLFRSACGLRVSDTQTGLRAFPTEYLPRFIKTEGERYEYETNMLLDCGKEKIPFGEVGIETVYIDDNSSSHFHPVRDSLRIYRRILKYVLSSFSSFLVDTLLFFVFSLFWKNAFGCFVSARLISSLFNYFVNKNIVFGDKSKDKKTLLKYYALCIPQMIFTGIVVDRLIALAAIESAGIKTLIKVAVDTAVFFVSYQIQKRWVFKNGK